MSDERIHPYEHSHSGVMDLDWKGAGEAFKKLADLVARDFRPEVVVGIAKGGVMPAVVLASAFRVDFFPVKLSSRQNEIVVRENPEWFVRPTVDIKAKRVLLVDDICVAGRTLTMAKDALLEGRALEVRTATLAVHSGSVRPDYFAIETDDCLIFPWDKHVLSGREWIIHPEYQEEIDVARRNTRNR